MMTYEEEVNRWGWEQLPAKLREKVNPDTVKVDFTLDSGYSCGCCDPYGSFQESPSVVADVRFVRNGRKTPETHTVHYTFFEDPLREILRIAGSPTV